MAAMTLFYRIGLSLTGLQTAKQTLSLRVVSQDRLVASLGLEDGGVPASLVAEGEDSAQDVDLSVGELAGINNSVLTAQEVLLSAANLYTPGISYQAYQAPITTGENGKNTYR